MEYRNDHSLDAPIVHMHPLYFNVNFDNLKLLQIFTGKIAFKLISTNFLRRQYMSRINTKETEPKQIQ